MSQKLNRVLAYSIPVFFGGLVFFCIPHAAGGYRVVKWACAGFLLCFLLVLLYRRLESLCLPSSRVLLIAAAVYPLSLTVALFADGMDIAISLAGLSRCCIGFSFSILTGMLWSSLDQKQKDNTLFLLLLIAALAAIPLTISFIGLFREGYIFEPDITGTFGNPNWAAGYFITALPVALYFLSTSSNYFKNLIVGITLLLVLCGIGVSLSKTGIFAGTVILIISVVALCKNKPFIKYTLFIGVTVSLVSIIYFHNTIFLWLQPRLFIWQALLMTMRDSWLTGNGALQALRNIEEGMAQLIGGNTNSYMPTSQVDFVHNDYLQAFADGGILGIISFLTIILLTFRKAYCSSSRIIQTTGLSFLALTIFAIGDSPLQVPVTFYAWWFLVAVIWFNDISIEGIAITSTRGVKVFLVLAMALFLTEGVRNSLGSYFWSQSGKTTTLVNQKKCLKQAGFFIVENGSVHTEYAQALNRSSQYREARCQALKAKSVKFAYDDLYVIAESDIALKVVEPFSAWQSIADKFPCLNYPKYKLAEIYFKNREYQLARQQCNDIINSCQSVNTHQPYYDLAVQMIEMIDKLQHDDREK